MSHGFKVEAFQTHPQNAAGSVGAVIAGADILFRFEAPPPNKNQLIKFVQFINPMIGAMGRPAGEFAVDSFNSKGYIGLDENYKYRKYDPNSPANQADNLKAEAAKEKMVTTFMDYKDIGTGFLIDTPRETVPFATWPHKATTSFTIFAFNETKNEVQGVYSWGYSLTRKGANDVTSAPFQHTGIIPGTKAQLLHAASQKKDFPEAVKNYINKL